MGSPQAWALTSAAVQVAAAAVAVAAAVVAATAAAAAVVVMVAAVGVVVVVLVLVAVRGVGIGGGGGGCSGGELHLWRIRSSLSAAFRTAATRPAHVDAARTSAIWASVWISPEGRAACVEGGDANGDEGDGDTNIDANGDANNDGNANGIVYDSCNARDDGTPLFLL